MKACGKVFKYGDNIDTDVIIPARYLNSSDPKELAKHCMEDAIHSTVNFVENVKDGDIIVAEKNFGCGSSREHAPIAIKASGISCVIAKTFARIFYRNAINIGLPILECEEAANNIEMGDDVEVDFDTGLITNKTKNETYQAFLAKAGDPNYLTALSVKVGMQHANSYFVSPAFVGSSEARTQVGALMSSVFSNPQGLDAAFKYAIDQCEYYFG